MRFTKTPAVLALLVLAAPAFGTTITQTVNWSPAQASWGLTTHVPKTVNQFDSGMGTLLSVTLQLSGAVTGSIWLENTGTAVAFGVSSSLGAKLSLYDGVGAQVLSVTPIQSFQDDLGPADADPFDYLGTDTVRHDSIVALDSIGFIYDAATYDLSGFIGLGTVTYSASAENVTWLPTDGIHNYGLTNAGANLTITYDYLDGGQYSVPEPATFFLSGAAILVCAAVRRRRSLN